MFDLYVASLILCHLTFRKEARYFARNSPNRLSVLGAQLGTGWSGEPALGLVDATKPDWQPLHPVFIPVIDVFTAHAVSHQEAG
jgi:hypothetical protein